MNRVARLDIRLPPETKEPAVSLTTGNPQTYPRSDYDDSNPRPALRPSDASEEPRLCGCGSHRSRSGHRGEHCDLQRREHRPAAIAAVRRSRPTDGRERE